MKRLVLGFIFMVSTIFAAPQMAPEFEAVTTAGDKVSLESYLQTKKPLFIYFTASWCPACAKNWPSINEIYKEYKDKVNFLSISIDPTDTNEIMEKLSKKHNLIYPMVSGNPKIMVDFGVKGQATTVLINSKGEITFMERGHITFKEYKELVDNLLANE